ncbi:MAG: LuxR C-terminal-related transcriptional regulator [Chloroflexota bacterium]
MIPLLLTKLAPPKLSHTYMVRQRLLDQLNAGTHGKLNLIQAPAGYGKTTLAAAWVATQQQLLSEQAITYSTAWLTLETYDNDPTQFLNYFIGAWQQINPDFGQAVVTALEAGQFNPQSTASYGLLNQLINELIHHPIPLVLVLDDWHTIENEAVQRLVQYWIEHVPPHIHTIITSRELPPMPLARWRVRGQLTVIDAPDLQFTVSEAGQFLRESVKLDLNEADIARLTAQTEGWIGALQLMALSLQGSNDIEGQLDQLASHERYLIDYLADEVMSQQSPELRQFFTETSILNRFNAELCDAVTERKDSHQLLNDLERRNLFVTPLDMQGGWYRYHPLVSSYLRPQLAKTDPEQYRRLHARAFQWLLKEGFVETAIEHALEAKNYRDVAQLLADRADEFVWRSRALRLFEWGNQLPEDILATFPKAALAFGWALSIVTNFSELTRYLDRMRPLLAEALNNSTAIKSEWVALEAEIDLYYGNIDGVITKLESIDFNNLHNSFLRGMMHQVQGYAQRLNGNTSVAIDSLKRCRQLIDQHRNLALWIYAGSDLAEAYMIQADLNMAEAVYQEIMTSLPSEQSLTNPVLDFAWSNYGSLQFKRNRLNEALDYVQRGVAISRAVGKDRVITRYGLEILARIRQAQGGWEDTIDLLDQIETFVAKQHNQRVRFQVDALRAHLHLLQGELDLPNAWAASFAQTQPTYLTQLQYHASQLVYAQWLLHRDPEAAIDFLTACQEVAEAKGWREHQLTGAVLLAVANQRLGQTQAALEQLRTAIQLARSGGYLRVFVERAVDIAPLLREFSRERETDPFIGTIQAAFLPTGVTVQPLVDPLTQREVEILQLIGEGLSNPQIAERMIIATGTVARHTNNIFGKLGVRNRTEATLHARRLGLI